MRQHKWKENTPWVNVASFVFSIFLEHSQLWTQLIFRFAWASVAAIALTELITQTRTDTYRKTALFNTDTEPDTSF